MLNACNSLIVGFRVEDFEVGVEHVPGGVIKDFGYYVSRESPAAGVVETCGFKKTFRDCGGVIAKSVTVNIEEFSGVMQLRGTFRGPPVVAIISQEVPYGEGFSLMFGFGANGVFHD
jgi:hypothetical protein